MALITSGCGLIRHSEDTVPADIRIEVFDEDIGSADDKIGHAVVDLGTNLGSAVEHAGIRGWIPGRWNSEGWFPLVDDKGNGAGELRLLLSWDSMSGGNSHRRDCHFAGTPFSSLLKRLRNVEGGTAE